MYEGRSPGLTCARNTLPVRAGVLSYVHGRFDGRGASGRRVAASSAAARIVIRHTRCDVKRVYGLPGDSLNGFTNSIGKHKQLEWIHVRHEEAAAFAAGAEGHLTNRLAVCAGSCGPATCISSTVSSIVHRSRVPVLAIASQIPSTELGTTYFQETYPEQLFKDCSHYCGVISEADHMPRILAIAMRTAIAKRGVAVIVLPGNIANKDCPSAATALGFRSNDSKLVPPSQDLASAAALMNDARRVTILAGAGCEGSHDELLQIAEHLQAPIVHAFRGKEFVEYDNPYDVGMTGLIGFSSGYRAMMNCDLLLAPEPISRIRSFIPRRQKKVQVDVRGEQIGPRTVVDVGLIGTVKETINALLPLLGSKKDGAHLKDNIEHYRNARKDLDEPAVEKPGGSPLHPEYVARVVDEIAAEDAIFTVDVGAPCIWTHVISISTAGAD
jgi:pyruvate dehydrogenase (quinone)